MSTKISYFQLLTIAITSAWIAWLGFPPMPTTALMFVAFVPLLFVNEQAITRNFSPAKHFLLLCSFFATFNILTTWWVVNSTPAGVIAFILNSLLMYLPFFAFNFVYKKTKYNTLAYTALPAFWLVFEYGHHQWELAWPWLTLGNAFAQKPHWIQWYEYTGTSGGTLWVWIANLLLFKALQKYLNHNAQNSSYKNILYTLLASLAIILLPIAASWQMYNHYAPKGTPIEAVAIQPNIDPWNEKFDEGTEDAQMQKFLELCEKTLTPNTQLVVFPETALPSFVWINDLNTHFRVNQFRTFLRQKYPQTTLLTGVTLLQKYNKPNATSTSRNFKNDPTYSYDIFNSAILIDSSLHTPFYHKSKLVPGSERMPYPQLFKFLEPLALNFGGMVGSHATQSTRTALCTPPTTKPSICAAAVICYESIFSEYVTNYITEGNANLICIITNDGWWGNTDGYKQHLRFASLRAIENRRSIVRAANTGISCFVNQRGDLQQTTTWWQPAAIRQTIFLNEEVTFYARYKDYISKIAFVVSLFSLCYAFFYAKKNKT